MSETHDKRRRTDLDLFVLALIESGVSTPYEFQSKAGLSPGATIPTLQRLREAGYVRQGKPAARRRLDYRITASGKKLLKAGWKSLIENGPTGDLDADLRIALLILWGNRDCRTAADFLLQSADGRIAAIDVHTDTEGSGNAPVLAQEYRRLRSIAANILLKAEATAARAMAERLPRNSASQGGREQPAKCSEGRSTREHMILTPAQVMAIIRHLQEPVRTMALIDAGTGLRASELTGLRWGDIDFESAILHVRRGVVSAIVGEVKTDTSRSQLPLAAFMLDALVAWRQETPYAKPNDWIFASPRMRGEKPFRANALLRRQVRTAVAKAGIQGSVGWHTFRRSISTWLIENEENVKVTQELLRHANSKTTLDLYAKAATPSKRRAHERIVNDLLAAQQRMAGTQARSYGSAEFIVG